MNNKVYDILKWIALICIPSVTVFLTTCMPVWGINEQIQTVVLTTIPAIGVLIGSLIAVSTVQYNKKEGEE